LIIRTPILISFFLFAGCSLNLANEQRDLANEPTPDYWSTGDIWAFSLLDSGGQIETVLFVRFTEFPAETCESGDAKQLDIVRIEPPPLQRYARERAYRLSGRALTINLTADLCDAYTELHGELTDTGFVGTQIAGGMMGHTEIGPVIGVRIPQLE